jgi:hypothetical protein
VAKEAEMLKRASTLFMLSLLVTFGFAKDKKKNTLPAYVLNARTVAVVIDPHAGFSIDNPQANRDAQKDVESALLNWGRFNPVLNAENADLIIVVRKGTGRLASETIHDPRQNNRPGSINSTDNGVAIGGQHGRQPGISDEPGLGPGEQSPQPQTEIGDTEDSFAVFRGTEGGTEAPLDGAPAWRYLAKDGLLSPSVPAVAAFKKAVADAEKAAAKTP